MQSTIVRESPAVSVMLKRGRLIGCAGESCAPDANESDDSSVALDKQLQRSIFQPLTNKPSHDEEYDENCEEGQILLVVESTPPVDANHLHGRVDESEFLFMPPATEQTEPETPIPPSPVPSSSDSSRACGMNTGMGRTITQQRATKPKPLRHRSQSTPSTKSSPSPLLLYSNPFSCYTPSVTRRSRGRRREVMGLSLFSYVQGDDGNDDDFDSESGQSLDEKCSDSSIKDIDDEEALEQAAKVIRMELLAAEMKELAVQAERAAEAGLDSFAAQPCVFEEAKTPSHIRSLMRRSLSAGDEVPAKPKKPTRRRTLSRDPLNAITSGTKLSVVDLRDIHEVFPSFRQFHTHLRTHFHRNHISESQLLFDEKNELQKPTTTAAAVVPKNDTSCKMTQEARAFLPMCNENTATPLPPVHRKQVSIQQEIMKTFSLEQWVPKVKDIPDFQPPAVDDDVGFFLANHITPSNPIRRGKVEVPPDLDEDVDFGQFKLRPRLGGLNRFRASYDSRWQLNAESARTYSEVLRRVQPFSENEIHHVMSLPSNMDTIIQPRALFDADEYDSTEEMETSHSSFNQALIRERPTQPSMLPPPPPPPPLLHPLSQPDPSASRKTKLSSVHHSRPAAPLDELGTSSNSILDGQGDRCIIFEQRLIRTTSIGDNSEGTIDNPIRIPSLDYDFVTPSRLRKIREFRKSSEAILADGTSCNILLPTNSMGDESPIRPHRFNFQLRPQHSSIQMPVLETVLDVSESLNISENTSNVSVLLSRIESEKEPELTKSSESQTMTLTTSSASDRCVDAETSCTESRDVPYLMRTIHDASQSNMPKNCSKNALVSKKLDPEGFYAQSVKKTDTSGRRSPDASRSHLLPRSWPSSPVSKMDFEFSEVSILDDSSRVVDNLPTPSLVGKDSGRDLGQKTPSLKRNGPDQKKTMTPQIDDCGCLSLSPDTSCDEDETAPPKGEVPIRKSTSTGALNEFHAWNDMLGNYAAGKCRSRHDHSKSFRAAMNMLSKLSPRNKNESLQQRALYVRPKENDEFLSNFLYCSRPHDGHNHRHHLHDELCDGRCGAMGSTACGDVNPGYCCTNILTDALALGLAVPRRQPVTSHKLVNLSGTGIPASKMDPDSWFDMANERFDDVLDHLAGGGGRRRMSSMSHFSFEAPTLKKKCMYGKSKAVVTILDDSKLEEEDVEVGDVIDEKKFDGIGLYDLDDSYSHHPPSSTTATSRTMNDSKHARHLSYISTGPDHHASIPHHLNALSDKQFEVIYGLSKEQIEEKAGKKMY